MKKGVEGWKWYEMGEGVFKGTESSGHPAKGAYVQYYYTAVQRLSCTSRYYPKGIPKVAYVWYF
jgi:hypothetical protein